ncbi:kinase-like domain-containing protein [Crepidotus variabilis]|uniref:Kinase-like domain-containing protein n=1 Tax=Crepidotus variabilis TaxID=179855 RepID=A0A9P6JJI7_9AGAR|nr:kinase-like domain-containing protein [Crepidotus variabilis]
MTPSLFNQLDSITYLEHLQRTLAPEQLRPLLADIDEGLQVLSSDDHTNSELFISRVAAQLRRHPKLLHQFNCLITPRFRLECSTSTQQVDHFVVVHQVTHKARIVSFAECDPALPTSTDDILNFITSKNWWDNLLAFSPDKGWLECVAQLVQEISDDPFTPSECQLHARKRLRLLSKICIVPPSLFIHSTTTSILRRLSYDPASTTYVASGGFCDVHKASVQGTTLCFRVLRQAENTDKEKLKEDFCRELITWQQLSHPNIISLVGASLDASPGCFSFVLPWMPHGSIMNYLKKEPNHDKFRVICEVADGIEYLHSLNVSHKDIKGANILVRPDLVCVLTDFGLATFLDSQRSKASQGLGTLFWMAPELFPPEDEKTQPLSKDSRPRDVYSFGCTIAEILIGTDPKFIMWSMLRQLELNLPPSGHAWTPEEADLWFLVQQCIQVKPDDRPTIQLVRVGLGDIRQVRKSPPLRTFLPVSNSAPDIPVIRNWLRRQRHQAVKPKPHRLHLRGLLTPTTPNHPVVIDLDSSDESSPVSPTLRVRATSRLRPLPPTPRISLARLPALPTPPDTPAPPSPGTPTSARLIRLTRRPSLGRLNPTSRNFREPAAQPASPLRQAYHSGAVSIISNHDQNAAPARSGLSRFAS